jgi:chromosome segregation ATPase
LEEGRARLELAERRALSLEEALDAERAACEAELARQAQEAADRQAVLQTLDHDRAELAVLYREAHRELHRVRGELSERTAEVWELRREQEQLRNEVTMRQTQNTCVVCLDSVASVACVPCGHLALCETCTGRLRRWQQCPVCRQHATKFLQIFAC